MKQYGLYAFADEAGGELSVQIKAMQRNCLQGLEIRNVNGMNVSALTSAQAREIRRQLDDAGLRVWSLGSPIGKIDIVKDDYPAHLEALKNTIDVAHELGTENIRMFSFYMPAGEDPAAYRNQVIDRLGEMAAMAKAGSVVLCHENEKGIYGDNAARCLDVLKAVPELACVFDPANFVQCGQDTAEAWTMLADRVRYLHIKDALANGQVVPAGLGIGHVADIVKDYVARGGIAMTLEPHLFEFVGLSSLEREGEKSVVGQLHFANPGEAFDAACSALKAILSE